MIPNYHLVPRELEKALSDLQYAQDIYGDQDGPWPYIEQAVKRIRDYIDFAEDENNSKASIE